MTLMIPFRWRRAVALGLVALPAAAQAQDPLPHPWTATRTARDVEILHGTVKVGPIVRPAPVRVLPAESKGWSGAPATPVAPPPAPREEPRPVIESRTIILTGYAGHYSHQPHTLFPADAPWLAMPAQAAPQMPAPVPIPATPAPAQQPTIVVIRDGESRPAAVEPSRGITLGSEALLGIGIGVAGLGFGFAGYRRRGTLAAEKRNHPAPPSPVAADGMMLMGKYNAGPMPASAEKFDLGPSYATVVLEKKKTEEQSQTAVLEFILNQNLALHAELAGPDDDLPEATELELDPDKN